MYFKELGMILSTFCLIFPIDLIVPMQGINNFTWIKSHFTIGWLIRDKIT